MLVMSHTTKEILMDFLVQPSGPGIATARELDFWQRHEVLSTDENHAF